jgi:curved DNA-binding protein CbpA
MDTPYSRLGVPESATPEQIQKARRALAGLHHPDLHGGSCEKEERLKQINADAAELLDPSRRAMLDSQLASARGLGREHVATDVQSTATDPLRPVWEATPFETIAEAVTSGRPNDDPWGSLLRGLGRLADDEWKAQLRSELYGRSQRRAVLATPSRCKAVKRDGQLCRNWPVPGNYGFCGVHR